MKSKKKKTTFLARKIKLGVFRIARLPRGLIIYPGSFLIDRFLPVFTKRINDIYINKWQI